MRYFICIIFSFLMIGQLAAQSFIYQKDFGQEDVVRKIILLDDGKIIADIGFGSYRVWSLFPFRENNYVMKFDKNGNLLRNIKLNSLNDNFIMAYQNKNYYTLDREFSNFTLFKKDSNFLKKDSLKILPYSPNNRFFYYEPLIENDNQLAFLITEQDPVNITTHRILKVDSNLNIIDYITFDSLATFLRSALIYNFDSSAYITFNSGNPINNNGMEMSMSQISFNGNIDTTILLDTRINFPQPIALNAKIMAENAHGMVLANKNLMVIGNIIVYTDIFHYVKGYDLAVIIYDSLYNFKKSYQIKTPDTTDYIGLNSIATTHSNIFVGSTKNWAANNYYKGQTSYFRLAKLDLDGNFISERFYTNGKYIGLGSILATDDGGILMAGYTYDSLNADSQGADAFMIKVDSLGNLVTSIDKNNAKNISDLDFLIYPNPAQSEITLQKVNQYIPYTFELYDINGKSIKQINWLNDQEKLSIETLKNGVYLYQIKDEKGRTAAGKIVKNN